MTANTLAQETGDQRQFDVGCTIEVEHTFESLHAHVELDGGVGMEPGDTIKVHGDPIVVPYGEKQVLRRMATVKRAGSLERAWTRATGDLEFMELLEFSFSSGSEL
ncbi:MAG: hypothetical protein AAGA00_15575 [Pseudomonadota bacterium]